MSLSETLGVPDFKTQSTFKSQAGVREYFYMDKLIDTFTVNEAASTVKITFKDGSAKDVSMNSFNYMIEIKDAKEMDAIQKKQLESLAEKCGLKDFSGTNEVKATEERGYKYNGKEIASFKIDTASGKVNVVFKDGKTQIILIRDFSKFMMSFKYSLVKKSTAPNPYLMTDEGQFSSDKGGIPLTFNEEEEVEEAFGFYDTEGKGFIPIKVLNMVLTRYGLKNPVLSSSWTEMQKENLTIKDVKDIAQKAKAVEQENELDKICADAEKNGEGKNGKFPVENIFLIIKRCGVKLPQSEIREILQNSSFCDKPELTKEEIKKIAQKAIALQNTGKCRSVRNPYLMYDDDEYSSKNGGIPLSSEQESKLQDVLKEFDPSGKEEIPKENIRKILIKYGIRKTEPEVDEYLKLWDIKKPKMNYNDIRNLAQRMEAVVQEEELEEIINESDSQKLGLLKIPVVCAALVRCGIKIPSSEIMKIINNSSLAEKKELNGDQIRRLAQKAMSIQNDPTRSNFQMDEEDQYSSKNDGVPLNAEQEQKLKEAIESFDKNGDGIPPATVPKVLIKYGCKKSEGDIQNITKDFDVMKKPKLNKDDVRKCAQKIDTMEKEEKIKKACEEADPNKSGNVQLPHLYPALIKCGITVPESQIKRIIRNSDLCDKKELSYDDVRRLAQRAEAIQNQKSLNPWKLDNDDELSSVHGGVPLSNEEETKLKSAISTVEKDPAAGVSRDFVPKVLIGYGVKKPEAEIRKIIQNWEEMKKPKLTYEEVKRVAQRLLTLDQEEKLKLLFNASDTSKKGKLPLHKVYPTIARSGVKLAEPEVKRIIQNSNMRPQKEFSYDDVRKIAQKASEIQKTMSNVNNLKAGQNKSTIISFRPMPKKKTFTPEELRFLMKLFSKVDKNNTGRANAAEIRKAFEEMGDNKVSTAEVEDKIKNATNNPDGLISFREFCNLIAVSPEIKIDQSKLELRKGRNGGSTMTRGAGAAGATKKKNFIGVDHNAQGLSGAETLLKNAYAADSMYAGATGAAGVGANASGADAIAQNAHMAGGMNAGATGAAGVGANASGADAIAQNAHFGGGCVSAGAHGADYYARNAFSGDSVNAQAIGEMDKIEEERMKAEKFLLVGLAKILHVSDFTTKDTFLSEEDVMEFSMGGNELEYFVVNPEYPSTIELKYPGQSETTTVPLLDFNQHVRICVYSEEERKAAAEAQKAADSAFKASLKNLAEKLEVSPDFKDPVVPNAKRNLKFGGKELESMVVNATTGDVVVKYKGGGSETKSFPDFMKGFSLVKKVAAKSNKAAEIKQAVDYLAQNIGVPNFDTNNMVCSNDKVGYRYDDQDMENFVVNTTDGMIDVKFKDGSSKKEYIYDFLKHLGIMKFTIEEIDINKKTLENRAGGKMDVDLQYLAQKLNMKELVFNALITSGPTCSFKYNGKDLDGFIVTKDGNVTVRYKGGNSENVNVSAFVQKLNILRIG